MKDNLIVNITELYETIQGESTFVGKPTVIVRLTGCNLRCRWCDSFSIINNKHPYKIAEILELVREYGHKNVCITGGEPLLQANVIPMMQMLCDEGYDVSLETNGSCSISEVDSRVSIIMDIKCPESQVSHSNDFSNLNYLKDNDEIKFVIAGKEDYLFACETCERYALYDKEVEILFSPVYGAINPQDLVKWILSDKLKVRLNMQIHKYIWNPKEQGI